MEAKKEWFKKAGVIALCVVFNVLVFGFLFYVWIFSSGPRPPYNPGIY